MRARDVHRIAQGAVGRHCDGDWAALRRTVQQLASGGGLRALLGEIATSEERLEEVRARLYRHPNGFDKLVLLRGSEPDHKLRLHVWWEGRPPAEPHVHNHRWDFATTLLLGSYTFQILEEVADGPTYHEYRYHSPGESDAFSMTPVGTARLRTVLEGRIEQGASYLIDHTALHRLEGEDEGITATLVLQGPVSSPSTRVLSPEQLGSVQAGDAVPLQRMTTGELRKALERILDEGAGAF